MESSSSGYVCAAGDTLTALMGHFIDLSNGSYLNDDQFSQFLSNTVDKFLYSFGANVDYQRKKLADNHAEKFLKVIKFILKRPFMKNIKLYLDSGGFQVAQGAFLPKDIPVFTDLWYNTVKENPNLFSYAFIQDIPPGPASAELFNSYKEIEDLNRESYLKCKKILPADIVRDKIIYIHHFRTPSLFDIWHRFLFEENLAEGFTYFGTGGIVAQLATDTDKPFILYVIPLNSMIQYAKMKNIKQMKFHILGGANFIDVFYHQLFSYHIKQYHKIDIDITYDSTALFKGLSLGRFVQVVNPLGCLEKMDLRSAELQRRWHDDTIENYCYKITNDVATRHNFKLLTKEKDPIYDERNTLSRSIHMYLMAYMLDFYKLMEAFAINEVHRIYPIYLAGEKERKHFNEECYEIVRKLNQGKESTKQFHKSQSIYNSLKILEKADLDWSRQIVEKTLFKDDIQELKGTDGGGRNPKIHNMYIPSKKKEKELKPANLDVPKIWS